MLSNEGNEVLAFLFTHPCSSTPLKLPRLDHGDKAFISALSLRHSWISPREEYAIGVVMSREVHNILHGPQCWDCALYPLPGRPIVV
jgi:hypothetical protein